jgi:hypothetical protein
MRMLNLSTQSGETASILVDMMGGIESFGETVSRYYDLFRTEEEKVADTTERLTSVMQAFGIALPNTRQAFRDLVESQDLSTEAGQNLFATLTQLAPAFDQIYKAAEQLNDVMMQTAIAGVQTAYDRFQRQSEQLEAGFMALIGGEAELAFQRQRQLDQMDPLLRGYQEELFRLQDIAAAQDQARRAHDRYRQALAEASEFLVDALRSINVFRQELIMGSGAATQQAMFGDVLRRALGGDRQAISELVPSAQAFLSAAESEAATSVDFRRQQLRVARQLRDVEMIRPEQLIAKEIRDGLRDQADTITTHMDDLLLLANVTIAEATATIEILQSGNLPEDIARIADMVLREVVDIAVAIREGEVDLPERYQRMILGTLGTLNNMVAFAVDPNNDLSKDDRSIVLGTTSELIKTIDFAVGSQLSSNDRELVLLESAGITRTIELLLDQDDLTATQRAMLMTALQDDASTLQRTVQAIYSEGSTGTNLTRLRTALTGDSSFDRTVNALLNDSSLADWERSFLSQLADTNANVKLDFENDYFNEIADAVGDGVEGVDDNTKDIATDAQKQISALLILNNEMKLNTNALIGLPVAINGLTDAMLILIGIQEKEGAKLKEERENTLRRVAEDADINRHPPIDMPAMVVPPRFQPEFGITWKDIFEEPWQGYWDGYGYGDVHGGEPAFANGGIHSGGMRLVGERGPELEMTGPSAIMSYHDLMSGIRQSSDQIRELHAIRQELQSLRSETRSSAISNAEVARKINRIEREWLVVRPDPEEVEEAEVLAI